MSVTPSSESAAAASTSIAEERKLSGNLGVWSIFFSVVAWAAPLLVVVGLMPSMIGFAGNGLVAGFAVTTSILLLFSVGYTAITRFVDRPGAFYTYITAGLGKPAGLGGAYVATFGYGLLVLSTWVAFGVFGRQLIANTFDGPELPWFVVALAGVVGAGVLSFFTIEVSARALTFALALEVGIVVVFDLFVVGDGGPDGLATAPFTGSGATEGSFGLAVLFAVLCFIGFESSAIYREEAKNPAVTIPRATYLAVTSIGVFYMIAAWVMITALGKTGVAGAKTADVTTMFNDLATKYVGQVIPDIVTVLVVTSTFACLLAARNAVARYGYSLGRDGVLPSKFGLAHPRHGSPYFSSALLTGLEVVAVVVIAAGTGFAADGADAFTIYIRTNGLGAMAVLFLMCIVSVAVLGYFLRRPDLRVGKAWQTTYAPVLGLVGLIVIFVLALQNVDALIGASRPVSLALAAILPLVFVAGLVQARGLLRRKPHVYERIGRQ